VLVLPALMIYLYGPREDRATDFDEDRLCRSRRARAGGGRLRAMGSIAGRLAPRYGVRGDGAWLLLMPLGVVAYGAFLGLSGGDPLAPLHAQDVWGRHFAGPYVGVWDGVKAAFDGARQLLSFQRRHVYFAAAGGSPFVDAGHNLMLAGFLAAALPAAVGVLRKLPLAYGAYVLAALALPLSDPVRAQPLMSLPRFLVVLFPLSIWLGAWLAQRPRAQMPALVLSGALMALFVGQFATWHWVA
jgi:hypothetical protein